MKIPVGYSKQSIDKAIKQVEEYQKRLKSIIPSFLTLCAQRIVEIANQNLDRDGGSLGIGNGIIAEIKTGWEIQPVEEKGKGYSVSIRNNTDKATYIEFGVGQVGANEPHENAQKAGYGYDLNNHGNRGWSFFIHTNDLRDIDIGKEYRDIEIARRSGVEIITRGQPALMYAFNAIIDFKGNKEFLPIIENLLKGL